MSQLCGTIANKKKTLRKLLETIYNSLETGQSKFATSLPQDQTKLNLATLEKYSDSSENTTLYPVKYDLRVENYITQLEESVKEILPSDKMYLSRWVALKLLDENTSINDALKSNLDVDVDSNTSLQEKLFEIKSELNEEDLSLSSLRDSIVSSIVSKAEETREKTCTFADEKYNLRTRKIDKILTSKKFGIPIMLIFLSLIFWITINRCKLSVTASF